MSEIQKVELCYFGVVYVCIDRVRLKYHQLKIFQVIIPLIFFNPFYATHNNPGYRKNREKSIVYLKII